MFLKKKIKKESIPSDPSVVNTHTMSSSSFSAAIEIIPQKWSKWGRGPPRRTLDMGKRPAEATKDSHREGHKKATGSKTKTKERGCGRALFLPFYGIRAIDEPF